MKIVVVKVGSSIIAPGGTLDYSFLNNLAKDVSETENSGFRVVLVSSGAIACGLNKVGIKEKPHNVSTLMAISSLGQVLLMDSYIETFSKYNKACAQILLTWDDFDNRKRFLNARQTINKLLNLGILPIINENDAVSFEEIRFGDNDRLSALVADALGAKMLVLLSDVEGLFDKEGRLVARLEEIDETTFALVRKKDKAFTSGGMLTKIEAARIATQAGIKTIIASGKLNQAISRIVKGEGLGTLFVPVKEKIICARKRWIAFSKKIKGKLYIDRGAKEAILNKGKSLLSVGIIKIEGDFRKKEAVSILDEAGNVLGCGFVNYSSDQLKILRGKKLKEEVVHRDNFVKTA